MWFAAACVQPIDVRDSADVLAYVDPRLGTGGIGAQVTGMNPGAAAPLGRVLVGPDTRHETIGAPGFMHFGGYHYDDTHIAGFSHTHSVGMGVNDLGAVHMMPRTGWNPAFATATGRMAPFDHDNEWASAGRYAVHLLDDGVEVEIVATERGAFTTASWPAGAVPTWVLDLGHTLGDVSIAEASATWDGASLTGHQVISGAYSGRYGGEIVHFAATFEPAPTSVGGWTDPLAPQEGASAVEGPASGLWFAWPADTRQVVLRLAVSSTDASGARLNHDAELAGDAAAALAATEDAWRAWLDAVRFEGLDDRWSTILHTAHYHTGLVPRVYADVDGRVRGLDGQIHTVDFRYLTDLSLWDTFRTLHPLWALAHPDAQVDVARSLVAMVEHGGSLPKWPLGHGYTGGMVSSPAIQVLADTSAAGIQGWDEGAAWDAAVATASTPVAKDAREAVTQWVERGFVAIEDSGSSASITLEHAWSDHALATWGDRQGRDVAVFRDRARNAWRGSVDPETGFVVGRHATGELSPIEDVFLWDGVYVEGNAWHYRYGAPWDVEGLIAGAGNGDIDALAAEMRTYWQEVYAEPDDAFFDDWYWHGNEPDLHYAALPALLGDPATTGDAVRWIATHRYNEGPTGLDGNDDGGTLSAWLLTWAIGAYPIGGTGQWVLAAPFAEVVEVPAAGLVIHAPGATPEDGTPRTWSDGVLPLPTLVSTADLQGRDLTATP